MAAFLTAAPSLEAGFLSRAVDSVFALESELEKPGVSEASVGLLLRSASSDMKWIYGPSSVVDNQMKDFQFHDDKACRICFGKNDDHAQRCKASALETLQAVVSGQHTDIYSAFPFVSQKDSYLPKSVFLKKLLAGLGRLPDGIEYSKRDDFEALKRKFIENRSFYEKVGSKLNEQFEKVKAETGRRWPKILQSGEHSSPPVPSPAASLGLPGGDGRGCADGAAGGGQKRDFDFPEDSDDSDYDDDVAPGLSQPSMARNFKKEGREFGEAVNAFYKGKITTKDKIFEKLKIFEDYFNSQNAKNIEAWLDEAGMSVCYSFLADDTPRSDLNAFVSEYRPRFACRRGKTPKDNFIEELRKKVNALKPKETESSRGAPRQFSAPPCAMSPASPSAVSFSGAPGDGHPASLGASSGSGGGDGSGPSGSGSGTPDSDRPGSKSPSPSTGMSRGSKLIVGTMTVAGITGMVVLVKRWLDKKRKAAAEPDVEA